MKVDNGTSGTVSQTQNAQPVAPPAQAAPPVPVPETPKEDFTVRQQSYMGKRESFASRPSVPAVQNVVAGQTFAYSPIVAGGNPAAAVGGAKPAAPQTRQQMLDDMAKDIKDPKQRAKIDEAAKAYSDDQLKQMKDNGLRFKMGDGMPAERADKGAPAPIDQKDKETGRTIKADGVYRPDKRTIQLKPDVSADGVRHEMAHAWDDAKNEAKDPIRTRDSNPQFIKDGKTEALQQKNAADQAVSLRAQAKAYGPPRAAKLNERAAALEKEAGSHKPGFASSDPKMVEAYTEYLKRTDAKTSDGKPAVSNKVFDNAASPGHSQTSVQEFYAEGYTTFHGEGPEAEKARLKMRQNAPELYEMLKQEATEQKLKLPPEPPIPKAPGGDPLRED